MNSTFLANGKALTLGKKIGRGGEGEIYALEGDHVHAFKRYTLSDLDQREAKVKAMVRSHFGEASSLAAFPIDAVTDEEGHFAGFIMNLISNHKPLFELYSPGARKQNFPSADYRFLVRVATNIARAVASVHQTGCVIGDINHSGILVSETAMAALIDADSFQFIDNYEKYLCLVGVPEYTPPELQGRNLSDFVRTTNHDAFGLAVVMFQLLFMGRHPFMGAYEEGDMTIEKAIIENRFAYSELRQVGMIPPPGAPLLKDFPLAVRNAFEAAFSNDSENRPSAEQWVTVLTELETSLHPCNENNLHYFSAEEDDCPWCRMENRLKMSLFLPQWSNTGSQSFGEQTDRFDMNDAWEAIESIAIPRHTDFYPNTGDFTPSSQTTPVELKDPTKAIQVKGIVIAFAIVAAGMVVPSLMLLWLVIAVMIIAAAFRKANNARLNAAEELNKQYKELENSWAQTVSEWRGRLKLHEIETLKRALVTARGEYERLSAERLQRLAQSKAERRMRLLTEYLELYQIEQANLSGINQAKVIALSSYGIDTAANIILDNIREVPGIRENMAAQLLAWRARLESQFIYSDRPNSADTRENERIEREIVVKASRLTRTLTAGPQDLANAVARTQALATTVDDKLAQINAERMQVEQALMALKMSVPEWKPNIPKTIAVGGAMRIGTAMSEIVVDKFFGTKNTHRGDIDQRNGKVTVSEFDIIKSIATGSVKASQGSAYELRIMLDRSHGAIKSAQCTCPLTNNCKHGAAVMFDLIRSGKL